MEKKENVFLAVLLTLLSSLCYAGLIALTKYLQLGLNSNVIVLFRYGVTFFLFVPYLFFFNKPATKTEVPKKHFIRSVFGFLGLVTTIVATRYIPVPDAILLSNTYPLFLPFIVWIHEKKMITKQMSFGILFGFLGIALILKPTGHVMEPWSLIALGSGLLTALTMTYVRELSKTESISQINFQFLFYSFIFAIAFFLIDFQKPTLAQLPGLLAIGLIGTIYQQSFLWALKFAHSIIVAPIFYSSIVFGALIEWNLYGTLPELATLIGCLFVVLGATITVVLAGQSKHLSSK